MIPINQLRVGSYWQLNTKTGQVLKIVTPCEIADAAEYGKGIGLTPEVLIKCGFEFPSVTKDVSQLFFLTTDRLGFRLQFEKSHEDVYVCESLPLLHIEYLHQLQNLYLSLTGTELIYTP